MLSKKEATDIMREEGEKAIAQLNRRGREIIAKVSDAENEELRENLKGQILVNAELRETIEHREERIASLLAGNATNMLIIRKLNEDLDGLRWRFSQVQTALVGETEDHDKLKHENDILKGCNSNQAVTIQDKNKEVRGIDIDRDAIRTAFRAYRKEYPRSKELEPQTFCGMCRGVCVRIRVKSPVVSQYRWTCPTCTAEKLDDIHDMSAPDFNRTQATMTPIDKG